MTNEDDEGAEVQLAFAVLLAGADAADIADGDDAVPCDAGTSAADKFAAVPIVVDRLVDFASVVFVASAHRSVRDNDTAAAAAVAGGSAVVDGSVAAGGSVVVVVEAAAAAAAPGEVDSHAHVRLEVNAFAVEVDKNRLIFVFHQYRAVVILFYQTS